MRCPGGKPWENDLHLAYDLSERRVDSHAHASDQPICPSLHFSPRTTRLGITGNAARSAPPPRSPSSNMPTRPQLWMTSQETDMVKMARVQG